MPFVVCDIKDLHNSAEVLMAYVRARGDQLTIVQGEREPETGKVEQRILFTLYSKAEALEALDRGDEHGAERSRLGQA